MQSFALKPAVPAGWVLSLGLLCMLFLSGCGTSLISASGPTSGQIVHGSKVADPQIRVVNLDASATRHLLETAQQARFSESLGTSQPVANVINRGDAVEVTIWEAPPAVLFGTASGTSMNQVFSSAVSVPSKLPAQVVDSDGRLQVPFVGYVKVAGRSPESVAAEVRQRLVGRAHDPQVQVSTVQNANQTVTVVGDVGQSGRIPLSSRGERILDVLALAGGVKQPVNKTTIRITRNGTVQTMPLDLILRDPAQNVVLRPDDVVTAFFQPYSFTVLGAAGQNNEVNFEGTGLTLAQALGRMGGLQDARANLKGIFIFRMERASLPEAHAIDGATSGQSVVKGYTPIIYRVDLSSPSTFFLAQQFLVQDKDVIYVSNAPLADLQKFVGIVSSVILPIASAQVLLKNN